MALESSTKLLTSNLSPAIIPKLSLIPTITKRKEISKGSKKVLDEDSYTEALEKIIQRDFFPDFSKLKAQNEYLEALEVNDVMKIREIQLKYCSSRNTSRPGTSLSTLFNTPSTFETPHKNDHGSPSSSINQDRNELNPRTVEQAPKIPQLLTLDQFLAKFTSEDNASFSVMMVDAAKRHQQKYPWLYHNEAIEDSKVLMALELPSAEQQAIQQDRSPLSLTTWSYKNRNALMYVPNGAEMTPDECIEKEQRREVVHANTRFEMAPFNETVNKAALAEAASFQAKTLEGKIGIDGKELIPKDTPKVNGYGFVLSTPSPAPGILDSPLMTWGEIEGTPFRLDGSDTPIPRTPGGPQFKIPDIPSRERLALSLADKVAKQHRTKKEDALKKVQTSFLSPSPLFGGNSPKTPMARLSSMSVAAQRLACAKLGIHRSSDKALTASYSPSPTNTPSRDRTPSSESSTPNSTPGSKRRSIDPSTLTDDLLNLSALSKRTKASEYF